MELHPAYLAGLFDGEGYVSLAYAATRRQRSDPSKTIRIMRFTVGITLTHEDILRRIQYQIGGNLSGPVKRSPNHRPIWRWNINGKDAQLRFLHLIADTLVVKRHAVALAIEYLGTVGSLGHRLSQDEWNLRLRIHTELRIINQRGLRVPVAPAPPLIVPHALKPSEVYSRDELLTRMQAVRAKIGPRKLLDNPSPDALKARRYRERRRLLAPPA